ncbi:MAG: hypothetical protein ACREEL_13045 [Stellaceae bacterium]
MPYRCYFFIDGHIRRVESLLDCYHDDEASAYAIAKLAKHKRYSAVEVWDHERKVYGLPAQVYPVMRPPSRSSVPLTQSG